MVKRRKNVGRRKRAPRRSLEEQIAGLESEVARLRGRAESARSFSPKAVLRERDRLELSAADYAELVGVSMPTIYAWEQGRSTPRSEQLDRWLAVKGIPKEDAWRRLAVEEDFSPEAVASERERLGLSAAHYARLVGVSTLTIYNWEKGKSRPQVKQLDKWLTVRGIRKRAAWRRVGRTA